LAKRSFLDSLTPRLSHEEPAPLVPTESAAVAVIFRDGKSGEEVLLIKRAEREGDPWSGNVALPGGRVSPADASFEETAKREALEEVGVELGGEAALFLGYMRELRPRNRDLVVVPSVFKLAGSPKVTPNGEVASYQWVPMARLAAREARSTLPLRRDGAELRVPSLVHGGLVVWGLTERILSAIVRDESY
jgi:8-oxo-dGTP pyrophosphatase MutT (NUDIX family)